MAESRSRPPSTHFHSCVRQADSTHTSKESVLFRKLGDLSFVGAEFCPASGRLWKSKATRQRRDRGDATGHTWQWKVKARTCPSEVRKRLPQIGDVFPRTHCDWAAPTWRPCKNSFLLEASRAISITNCGNFGLRFDVGGGGGVEPLGEISPVKSIILVPK